MEEDTRATMTGILWFLSTVVLAFLFISAAAQGELSLAHIVIVFVILALAVMGTAYFLRLPQAETAQQKAKRETIDNFLRDLSDKDLIELKERLASENLEEQPIAHYLDDDGELVRRN